MFITPRIYVPILYACVAEVTRGGRGEREERVGREAGQESWGGNKGGR